MSYEMSKTQTIHAKKGYILVQFGAIAIGNGNSGDNSLYEFVFNALR